MTLPSFLGIGAQKCGTSWLTHVLAEHPQLYLPEVARELHFFDLYYDRGLPWYRSFFEDAPAGAITGEITPSYIFHPDAVERIAETLPECRLIAILRDPVERLQSQYRMAYASGRFSGNMEAFLASDDSALPRGFYGEQLGRYLTRFPRERLLVLIFEEIFADEVATAQALERIAGFLGVDPAPFAAADIGRRINENSGVPRFRAGYRLAHQARRKLRDWDMNWALDLVQKSGIKRGLFGGTSPPPALSPEEKDRLSRTYASDGARLAQILGREAPLWAPPT
jgi:hypothetical protein